MHSHHWLTWWNFNKERFLVSARTFPGLPRSGNEEDATARPAPNSQQIRSQILPALTEILESDPGTDLLNATMMALARIGGQMEEDTLGRSTIAETLRPYLGHADRNVQENACAALGVLAEPGGATLLAQILLDQPAARKLCRVYEVAPRMRAFAAYGLGLTAHRSENPDVRRFLRGHLLAALNASENADIQVACVIALGMVPAKGGDAVVPLLVDRLLGKVKMHELARAHVPTTLAKLHPGASPADRDRIVNAIVATLDEKSHVRNEVRQSAALALGKIGDLDEDETDRRIRKTLMRTAVKGNQDARHFSLFALAQIAGRRGHGDGDPVAADAEIRAFVLGRLARSKAHARPWAALAMGLMGRELSGSSRGLSAEERAALSMGFESSKAADITSAYSVGLGLGGNSEATELLSRRVGDTRDPLVQLLGATGLGLLRDGRGIAALRRLLPQGLHDPDLLEQTARSLELLGDERLVTELIDVLEECDCSTSTTAVARALGRSKDARAIAPLLGMLGEGPESQQAWVVHALGRLADPDELAWTSILSTDINYLANPPSLTSPEGAGILDYL